LVLLLLLVPKAKPGLVLNPVPNPVLNDEVVGLGRNGVGSERKWLKRPVPGGAASFSDTGGA
jgi:hypothetical protein